MVVWSEDPHTEFKSEPVIWRRKRREKRKSATEGFLCCQPSGLMVVGILIVLYGSSSRMIVPLYLCGAETEDRPPIEQHKNDARTHKNCHTKALSPESVIPAPDDEREKLTHTCKDGCNDCDTNE